MARKRFTAEQIIMKLREAEVGLAQGKTVPSGPPAELLLRESVGLFVSAVWMGLSILPASKGLRASGLPSTGTGTIDPTKESRWETSRPDEEETSRGVDQFSNAHQTSWTTPDSQLAVGEFLVLTAARSGEVRLVRWNEIDNGRAPLDDSG